MISPPSFIFLKKKSVMILFKDWMSWDEKERYSLFLIAFPSLSFHSIGSRGTIKIYYRQNRWYFRDTQNQITERRREYGNFKVLLRGCLTSHCHGCCRILQCCVEHPIQSFCCKGFELLRLHRLHYYFDHPCSLPYCLFPHY